jgi:hypothetical protein
MRFQQRVISAKAFQQHSILISKDCVLETLKSANIILARLFHLFDQNSDFRAGF